MASEGKRVCVCVMGDIGHSPRMQYHSLSLAENGFAVDIVSYRESTPHYKLTNNPNITFYEISVYKNIIYFHRYINYFLKVVFQLCLLFWTLWNVPKPSHILVQNPPSIPALLVVKLICKFRGCRFVIDWHNYGFSILALSLGESHFIVKAYQKLEFFFGKLSDDNLCVSKAMQVDLEKRIKKHNVIVLYDRPYSFFQPLTSIKERHTLFLKLQDEYDDIKCEIEQETLFTRHNLKTDIVELKLTRPAILISSTSWTEDEDFQILLDALYEFDQEHVAQLIHNNNDLKVVCFITGKGPLKSYYIDKLKSYSFKHTKFVFPWLSAEDYPRLLACADLGICLHKSSSGLDLPMKVVDMFGSSLPVCAYNYQSISELVLENHNGLLFQDSSQLTRCLANLLQDFPNLSQLKHFKDHLEKNFRKHYWSANWNENVRSIF